ncbi:unnamed protein product [Haemonchus placei]|uniref:Uncharacterized protein n=1 Tax=Haemonchus placei TaxID=6290 RepID=A0A3P7TI86_HAEPC|nr:unnamed protein product [Haemonchus placei]
MSASLFIVTIALYGLSVVVFAAFISSLFKTPSTAVGECFTCSEEEMEN